ncbi:hypothetical protein PIB30_035902 [Stylosanthes scabra]|uniref:Uncharacterized protein n=1 Tax=Stylosanthes scabra TaxID=79078 RepID=A0ABU6WE47_9FABA|nr:hypothetical protein [Stylosanthes scabra]
MKQPPLICCCCRTRARVRERNGEEDGRHCCRGSVAVVGEGGEADWYAYQREREDMRVVVSGLHGAITTVNHQNSRHCHRNSLPLQPPPVFFKVTGSFIVAFRPLFGAVELRKDVMVMVAGLYVTITAVVHRNSRFITAIPRCRRCCWFNY